VGTKKDQQVAMRSNLKLNSYTPATLDSLKSFMKFLEDKNISSRKAWREWTNDHKDERESNGWPYEIGKHFKSLGFSFPNSNNPARFCQNPEKGVKVKNEELDAAIG